VAACGRPVRVAPPPRERADLPRLALESDGTAVGAWTENGSVRVATRAPGKTFGSMRAIAMSPRWRCPMTRSRSARTRSSSSTPAGPGATLVASLVTGAIRRAAEQAAATTAPITEAAGALRPTRPARGVRRGHLADDGSRALRARRRRLVAAGGIALPPAVTIEQQLQLALLSDAAPCSVASRQGPAAGDVPRVRRSVRSAVAPGEHRRRSIRSRRGVRRRGHRRRRKRIAYAVGVSPTARAHPTLAPGRRVGAALRLRRRRTPRDGRLLGPAGPSGGGVLLAG